MFRKLILIIINLIVIVKCSHLSEESIDEFENGINELRKLSEEYEAQEETYNSADYDDTHAWANAIEYDFIIIGAGAAGTVIANRLSEIHAWKILLLEAGEWETEYTQVPRLENFVRSSPYNWGYKTIPQETWCQGMIDKQCVTETGKAVGGGTAINGMIFTRGNAKDYDNWAKLGNPGWSYNDVLPYFKKYENAHIDYFDCEYHNYSGPFYIETVQYTTKLSKRVLKAGKELNMETVDYNGQEQLGLSLVQTSTKHGKRNSVARAYLKPIIEQRDNLIISSGSRVTKIIINKTTKEAIGVQYVQNKELFVAKALNEIILSAGAVNSPQLLMLSGIGLREELDKHSIELIKELHVGENLHDHLGFLGLNFIYTHQAHDEVEDERQDIIDYLKYGKGPLTSFGAETIGFLQTLTKIPSYPDIEIVFRSSNNRGPEGLKFYRITDEIYDSYWKPWENKLGFEIMILMMHPKSVGTVTLKDKNPFHFPLLNQNLLSDPDDHDINTMVAGIRAAIKLVQTDSFQKAGVSINDNPLPGCEKFEFDCDDYWKCAVRHLSISLRHLTGTTKMGPITDKKAVVNNKLKIYGIQKLRVADAGIIPVTISGHTMAPTIMIGEKAADLIKSDWL